MTQGSGEGDNTVLQGTSRLDTLSISCLPSISWGDSLYLEPELLLSKELSLFTWSKAFHQPDGTTGVYMHPVHRAV